MNTRLQVEHRVTEMITGLDLVELQLRVAAGEALPFAQKDLSMSGHSIEARIYAEDPSRDFLPATGRLIHLVFPEQSDCVRVDAGVEAGGEITHWYDPMIAKLIVRGADARATRPGASRGGSRRRDDQCGFSAARCRLARLLRRGAGYRAHRAQH